MLPRMMTARHRLALSVVPLLAFLGFPGSTPLRAQGQTLVVPGRLTERVVSPTDTAQSYALYVPADYDGSRSWPLLVVMDPRGRALEAIRPFLSAAEQYGWIVMSSYDTRSDGPVAPNVTAVNAMLADASATFHLDARRVHLAGLSGTARLAWHFAARLGGQVAGIYGSGAGGVLLTRYLEPPEGLVFFGAAGTEDFNYDEVRGLEGWLDDTGVPHRLRFFDGGHEWPPESVASEAVAWFELKAMDRGVVIRREAFVDSLRQSDEAAAARLEAEGRGADALDRYREIVADYGKSAAGAAEDVERLTGDPDVQADLERRRRERFAFEDFMGRVTGWVVDLAGAREPTAPSSGVRILGIEELKARASSPDATPAEAASAVRQLASAHVLLGFYQPREFLEQGEAEKALVVLDVAAAIRDDDAAALVLRAEAQVALGRREDALDTLERAVAAGASPASLREDPRLEPLRGETRFRALGEGVPRRGTRPTL